MLKTKELLERTKAKMVDASRKAIQFAKENPETCGWLVTIGTATIGGLTKGVKMIHRNTRYHRDKYLKERYIYDRSLGMYLKTRRPLRNNDYVAINRRRRNGEKLSDILTSMRLLN